MEERASVQVAGSAAERGKNTPSSCALPEKPITTSQRTVSDLAASFLDAIGDPFGDRSPKGSQTRLHHLLGETEPTDVLQCLVRAYVVARDTRTIRAIHCSPTGLPNRMPLFFAMVQRFLRESALVSDEHWLTVEETLVSDPCLTRWWKEHQRHISLPIARLFPVNAPDEALQEAEEPGRETGETLQRGRHWSQSDAERESRADRARRVLRRLSNRGVVLEDGIVLWEHLTCGRPLYHRPRDHEVCALCFPDPAWPEDVLALLRSIVQPEEALQAEDTGEYPSSTEEHIGSEPMPPGWADRDTAYQEALHALDALTLVGKEVEVFLEPVGSGYQVVIRDGQSEDICTCHEHIGVLIVQTSWKHLRDSKQGETMVCSTV